ncbi:coiled-coil domain-containing protein 191 [Triplophysa rosa]|uniref:Coiled-coil domain-containing protein KIAA1407-like protein n=1 Tax=Triplophysa rosa TaxID=992332 RepID=A0A9W7WBH0_TRIRA|nr:coiled-coil domain-containing protein 191 [Triplophysa rosa]KAI7792739.1 coiled-coil domain-containing protein KIAA1407-like protein [Triplophysa rosa]
MAYSMHRPDIFRWKTFNKSKTGINKQAQLNEDDIKQWMKKVEMASEFAVAEVFSLKKAHSGKHSVALQSIEQLQDHDDAYSEAQSILSEWMNQKLRLELEMDDEEEEEEMSKMENSETKQLVKNTQPSYNNFDEMYSLLSQEEENSVVENFLQDLMETEVLDFRMAEDLKVNSDETKKTWRDPSVTIEMRHKQVKENRARRDAEREQMLKEKEVLREAREGARRLEQEKQARKKQEARKQEEMIQQEMIRLRREMEEKRNVELLARNMERDRLQKQRKGSTECSVVPKPPNSSTQKKRDKDLQPRQMKLEAKVNLLNLKCIHRHFSAWYSVVLERRVCMGKAAALCDWRRQLRAWRAWRALVWSRIEEREAKRTEEELRQEHRRCKQAVDSDRRRLLRRCLSDWHVWCRVERERKELLKQQEETRCKMAALIRAAASGKLGPKTITLPPITSPPGKLIHSENISHQDISAPPEISSPAAPATLTNNAGPSDAPPTQAWQVTRRHTALSPSELQQAREGQKEQQTVLRTKGAELTGEQFKHRHAALQQTVAEQRRLLKEQQEQILHLQQRQNMLELRHEVEKTALLATVGPPGALSMCSTPDADTDTGRGSMKKKTRPKTASGENGTNHTTCKAALGRSALPHPSVQGMEERARQRAERRREMEEQRRKREEEKLAQMKAAEEEKLRLEEEEKQKEAENKREGKRQQRMRELEKQKRVEQEKEMLQRATQHYLRTLLHHRGLAPWKRLLEQSHINKQRAADHYTLSLQRSCFCSWVRAVDEAHAEREASAIQLYHQILLQRAMSNWKRFKDMRFILEARAERYYRTRTERKVIMALLDHATEQRLTAWDNNQRAEEHNARKAVKRCFASWRRLPAVLREEKEREARREQLRRKVAEILPDFRFSPVDLPEHTDGDCQSKNTFI